MTPPPALHQEYDPEQCATLLRRSPIFKDLPADLLGRLAQLARVRRLDRGALLFAQGDEGGSLFAVVEGLIAISIVGGDRELTLGLMESGDVFGEIALLDGLPRTATARAVEACVLLAVDRAPFLLLIEQERRLSRYLIELLCERLRTTTDRLSEFAFLDLRTRLARRLEALAIAHGKHGLDGILIDLKLSQTALAHMLGVSREAVNKQLKAWSTDAVLRLDRGYITILDKTRLTADSTRQPG